jgi:ABC-2 type transport system permease protein
MPIREATYQHWPGERLGIWRRRVVIAATGLKACLASKHLRRILGACWFIALAEVAVYFLIGQLLVPDSFATQTQENFSRQIQAILRGLVAWLNLHPEISVRVTQDFLFYQLSGLLMVLTMFAVAMAIPHLITRDLSSRAIVIYSSKALSRWDYLVGKFGAVFGLIGLTWILPVTFAWLLGNLLAPHWHFFWHSRLAFVHALAYALCGAGLLSGLALGVSAISSREKVAVAAWMGLWLVGSVFSRAGRGPRGAVEHPAWRWLENLSTTFNLDQIGIAIFRLKDDLDLARENIPLLGQFLRGLRRTPLAVLETPDLTGALVGLAVMLAIAAAFVIWRVRPE